MGFSCPVSFTHVYLLIWLWLCKDNGGDFGGDTNRYIAKYILKAWTECRCFGGVTVLFLAICFTGGGPAELGWRHRHEGVRSSLRYYIIGIIEFRINIPVLLTSHAVCRADISLVQAIYTKSSLTLRQPICLSSVCFSCLWQSPKSKKKHWHIHYFLHTAQL